MKKKIIGIFLAVMMLFSLVGCGEPQKAEDFTVEEHVQRIREYAQELDWKFDYEGFEVYPLYDILDDQSELMNRCLIEFEPYGFAFIKISYVQHCSCMRKVHKHDKYDNMYSVSDVYIDKTWSPYIPDNPQACPFPEPEVYGSWILNENGERIFYNRSPYFVYSNANEKKYFINLGGSGLRLAFICAVKRNGEFINLISGLKFNIDPNEGPNTRYVGQAFFYIGGLD